MATRVSVLNAALAILGEPLKSGPNDTSSWVEKLTALYETTVVRLEGAYPWDFNATTEALAIDDTFTPITREYAYAKPAGLLRVKMLSLTADPEARAYYDYEDQDGRILSDATPLYMHFHKQLLDQEGMWPEAFAFAVSSELAWLVSPGISKPRRDRDEIRKDKEKAWRDAKSWDAAQKPHRRLPHGNIVQSALSRTSRWAENG